MNGEALIASPNAVERRLVGKVLRGVGLTVLEAASGPEGLSQVLECDPKLIVLAEELPPLEANEVLVLFRRLSDAPIILLGDGGDPQEQLALELGADSYLRRPLSLAVLLARGRALLRRYPRSCRDRSRRLERGLEPLRLTNTERRLLACLSTHCDQLVSPQELLQEVWGGAASPDTVKMYLRRLRQKLAATAIGPRLMSLRGAGHRVVWTESEAVAHRQAVAG